MRIVSWNMKWNSDQKRGWQILREMDADIALLQEARRPPRGVNDWAELDPEPWRIAGHGVRWRSAIARLSDRVEVDWIPSKSLIEAGRREFAVSRPGSIVAATVNRKGRAPIVVVSMYAVWEKYATVANRKSKILAVGSAHRVISDLSRLVGSRTRLIAAGDLNAWNRKGGEHPTPFKYLDGGGTHYRTIFDRMGAIGVPFIGPHGSEDGLQPDDDKKRGHGDVVTFKPVGRVRAANRMQQLDFVFATRNIRRISARALNDPDEWGPSDHCRILIEIGR